MFKTKFGKHIYKRVLVSQRTIILPSKILDRSQGDSMRHGLVNMLIGWSISYQNMSPFVYVAIKFILFHPTKLVIQHAAL